MSNDDDPPIFYPDQKVSIPRYGDFVCEDMIGEGGNGAVFKFVREGDGASGKAYAVKAVHPKHWADDERMRRFAKECEVIAKIRCRNICGVHGLFHTAANAYTPSVPVIMMDYLSGISLRACLSRGLRPIYQAQIAIQLLKGVGELHRAGIVHRDIKPENALLDDGGNGSNEVVLLDYGIVYVIGEPWGGSIDGSPGYMSPAQWLGHTPTVLDDIYSVSVLLYELFAGRRLFPNVDYRDHQALRNAHLNVWPTPLHELVPPSPPGAVSTGLPEVVDMIQRGLSKDPGERPPSAAAYVVPFNRMLRRLQKTGSTETLQDMFKTSGYPEMDAMSGGPNESPNRILRGATTAPSAPPPYPTEAPRFEMPPAKVAATNEGMREAGASAASHFVSHKPTLRYDYGPVSPQRAQVAATTTTTTPSTLPRMEKTIEHRPVHPETPTAKRRLWMPVVGASLGLVIVAASVTMFVRPRGDVDRSHASESSPTSLTVTAPPRAVPPPASESPAVVVAAIPEVPMAPSANPTPVAASTPARVVPGASPKRPSQPARTARGEDNHPVIYDSTNNRSTTASGPKKAAAVPPSDPAPGQAMPDTDIFPNLQASPSKPGSR